MSRRCLALLQKRNVSRMCWDNFGFRKDGTDWQKRWSVALSTRRHPLAFKIFFTTIITGPAMFVWYMHGVFERRTIRPLEPNWDAENPLKPPEGYENPLFEPGRRYAKIRSERRKKLNAKRIARGQDPI